MDRMECQGGHAGQQLLSLPRGSAFSRIQLRVTSRESVGRAMGLIGTSLLFDSSGHVYARLN